VNAASTVWAPYGIADRIGYSIVAGHGHCRLHPEQQPEVKAFIDRFLLGRTDVSTDVHIAPAEYGQIDLKRWITW
jgi:hypothetical protein